MLSDSGTNDGTGTQVSQSQQTADNNNSSTVNADNPKYEAIFDDTYIVHFKTFLDMEMENFAMKKDGGIIACADYGYEDDVVKQWVEMVYIPISRYTDAQKTDVDSTLKTQFASIDALNCCVVTYKMGVNYFTITCTHSDVDQATMLNCTVRESYRQIHLFQCLLQKFPC